MKLLFISLALVLAATVFAGAQTDIRLESGKKLPKKYVRDTANLFATDAAQTRPYIEVTIGQVDYDIAYEKETRKIKYIQTNDTDFKTSNGLRVGDEISILGKDIEILDYFQFRAPAGKDGWQPVIYGSMGFEREFVKNLYRTGGITTRIEGFVKGSN